MATSKIFDLQKVSKHYQILDCVSLCIIYNKLARHILNTTGMTMSKYLTAPEISLEYLKRFIPAGLVMTASKRSVDYWIRKSIQGGKVFPQKGSFYSSDCSEIHKLFNEQKRLKRLVESYPHENQGRNMFNEVRLKLAYIHKHCEDYLHDLDMTSLYPTEMNKNDFPAGTSAWEEDEAKVEEFRNKINNGESVPLSIVECDIDFKVIEGEARIFPILANRLDDTENLYYSFENNQHFVKTSVILEDAVKYNQAYMTKIYNLYVWSSKYPLFCEAIQKLFDGRVKAKEDKNDALATMYKLVMNGGNGKFSQKIS